MAITREQALDCFASDDLIGIGMEAAAVRRTLHPEGVVSYVVQAAAGSAAEAAKAIDRGATELVLARQADVKGYAKLAEDILRAHPEVCLEASSAAELVLFGDTGEAVARLAGAGIRTVSGTGMRDLGADVWLRMQRTAHAAGLRSQAVLVFGAGESAAERVEQLESMQALQLETGGFTSFIAQAAPAANGRELDEATAVEYLKTLAVARMVLDGIENVEADLKTQGLKVLQMALRFGANDAGAVETTGLGNVEEVRRLIRDAGFEPVERDGLYTRCFLG